MSLATSGNYRKYWEDETGQKVVHSIDPETGRPVISNLLSASIIAPDATTADALATACMIKGIAGATRMLERFPNVEGYFIVGTKFGDLEVVETPGWNKYTVN
jgi:thiamine biosynthesis lipoprotein